MIIYKITNLINNKIYVGKDRYNNPKYLGSGVILKKAIKKYGKDNFVKDILQQCSTIKELNKSEIYWINELNSRDRNIGYNISLGGDGQKAGTKLSEETKQKISKAGQLSGYIERYGIEIGTMKYNDKIIKQSNAQIERFKNPEELKKVTNYGNSNGMFGKTHTIESKDKNRNAHLGKTHKESTIELYKQSRKGKNNGMYNKGHLLIGANNGRAKTWKIINTSNEIFIVTGELELFTKEHNLSIMLFRLYKNNIIPLDLKIRGKNKHNYDAKLNSLGWSIYDIT